MPASLSLDVAHADGCETRVLDAMLAPAHEAGLEWLMLDSTTVHAHSQVAVARQAKGDACPGPWRVSRRIKHEAPCACDALGFEVRMIGGLGQENDVAHAHKLISSFEADYIIADKGYDVGSLVEASREHGAEQVIPPRNC
jgi:hypothetical protein